MTDHDSKAIQREIERLLGDDPACMGRVCSGTVEAIAALAKPSTTPDVAELIEALPNVDRYIRKLNPLATIGLHCIQAADALASLSAQKDDLCYHAEQAWTYVAQPSATDTQVASARHHINKIRASLSPQADGAK